MRGRRRAGPTPCSPKVSRAAYYEQRKHIPSRALDDAENSASGLMAPARWSAALTDVSQCSHVMP